MSAVSDKLKNIINSVLNAPKDDIEEKIDIIVKNTRLGKDEGVKVKRILDKIEETEDIQEVKGEGEQIVEDITDAIDDAQKNLEEAEQKKKAQKKQQDKLNKEINGD